VRRCVDKCFHYRREPSRVFRGRQVFI
jgi:hypothetical protein